MVRAALGQQIKQYRRKQGLSIKKLAKQLGIDPTTLARWEKIQGKFSPKEEKVFRTIIGKVDFDGVRC